jgi:hypothetical protein
MPGRRVFGELRRGRTQFLCVKKGFEHRVASPDAIIQLSNTWRSARWAVRRLCSLFHRLNYSVRVETPNDPKLSDRRSGRGPCTVGATRGPEAGAVTVEPVRCSAWLGAFVVLDVTLIRTNNEVSV